MGVFAMFRRKSSTTAATDVTVDTAAEAADVTEEPQGAMADPVEADTESGGEVAEPVAAEAKAEAVEIPKQQSAEAAADNGAGEGARK